LTYGKQTFAVADPNVCQVPEADIATWGVWPCASEVRYGEPMRVTYAASLTEVRVAVLVR